MLIEWLDVGVVVDVNDIVYLIKFNESVGPERYSHETILEKTIFITDIFI